MEGLYCLMVTGFGITEEIRTKLFFTAQEMFKKGLEKLSFSDSYCEGGISTEWKIAGMGDTYGYLFKAVVEWGDHKTTLTFIAKKTDLKRDDLVWVQIPL